MVVVELVVGAVDIVVLSGSRVIVLVLAVQIPGATHCIALS